jgi:hypothetical protein
VYQPCDGLEVARLVWLTLMTSCRQELLEIIWYTSKQIFVDGEQKIVDRF